MPTHHLASPTSATRRPRRRLLLSAAVLALAAQLPAVAQTAAPGAATNWPTKPIRFVVGFAPGNSIDGVARVLAEHVRAKLGQPVTVDNKVGANGMLAATDVAKAAPDGYTVLISNSSTITVNPLLYKKISYDVEKDLTPVTLVVSVPFILTVNPDKDPAVTSLAALVTKAKARPDSLSYGSAGAGNLTQLSFELLNQMAGARMVHIPYKGSALAQVAVLGKEVDAAFDNPAAMPQIKAGKLRALAVTSAERWHDLPDVPTIAEAGYAGYDISFWVGALATGGTPPAVVAKLNDAIRSGLNEPAVKAQLQALGRLQMLGPQPFAARIKSETAQYAEIVKRANISLD